MAVACFSDSPSGHQDTGSEERSTDWDLGRKWGDKRAKQTGLDIYGASANELSFEKIVYLILTKEVY